MPEKKPSKEQCQKAIAQIKQMKDQKQMMNGLKQLIKAGCITQEQAQVLKTEMEEALWIMLDTNKLHQEQERNGE